MFRQALKHFSTPAKNVRSFATKGKRGKKAAPAASTTSATNEVDGFSGMVQPKVQLFGIPARYANAVYSVASKENALELVEKELKTVQESMAGSDDFVGFLEDPTISRAKKKDQMVKLVTEAKLSKPVQGLFTVLAENGRLPDTATVIDNYMQLMSAYRGEVQAKVISADPLTSAQVKQVEKALTGHLNKDEKLILQTEVDPKILGGLKVHIGAQFIDLSLETKINKIHSILKQPVA